jgi:vacuolar-type H+-ATPase subunit D/Vma8
MPDILKQVDQSEKDKVLSLSEIEKAFDNTAKEIQGQKDLVNALNKNLSDDNPKYTL